MKIAVFPSCLVLVLLGVTPALAQPEQGTVAVGADFGLVLPTPSTLDSSATFGGLIEYYFTSRIGARATVHWFELALNDRLLEMSNRRVGLHGTYNWEHGKWHPFAGGGFSINSLEVSVDDDDDDDDADNDEDEDSDIADSTKPGLDLFGGVEYFFRARTTIKAEIGFQRVADFDVFDGPSNLSLFVGVKHYLGR